MGYKLQGESLEYAALHLLGAEVAQGGMALLVTATSAPDATVLSWHLAKAYNPGRVVGDDGSSATFRMDFRNKLETNFAYSDMQGAIGLYRQAHGGSSPAQAPEPNPGHAPHEAPYVPVHEPAAQNSSGDAGTYAIVGAAALIIVMLLWE
jgi:hypothetical protein